MIVVDTSALFSIVLNEPEAERCMAVLEGDPDLLISAGTMAEALIVAARRGVIGQMRMLLDGLGLQVLPVTAAESRRIALAYERWGKGLHPAGLNFGDCFAYAAAEAAGCPVLFVGNDFARTDVRIA